MTNFKVALQENIKSIEKKYIKKNSYFGELSSNSRKEGVKIL